METYFVCLYIFIGYVDGGMYEWLFSQSQSMKNSAEKKVKLFLWFAKI